MSSKLIGQFFYGGPHRGRVLEEVESNLFMCETYDSQMKAAERRSFRPSAMNNWAWFTDEQEWREYCVAEDNHKQGERFPV